MVNFAYFHNFSVEIFAVIGCGIDGAINTWHHHLGQVNWKGTPWERKMLAKQLEGVQENKKERPSIMSCTSGVPSFWCRTSSVTVALSDQGSVCFHCRCNEDCHSITTIPIASCIMHAHSAYFFCIMAKQQHCMEVLHVQSAQFHWWWGRLVQTILIQAKVRQSGLSFSDNDRTCQAAN